MQPSTRLPEYTLVRESDSQERRGSNFLSERQRSRWLWASFVLISTLAITYVFIQLDGYPTKYSPFRSLSSSTSSACLAPATRREWRSLSKVQKLEYIGAVQCLSTLPSMLNLDQSLYHDFPYIHTVIGNQCRLCQSSRHPVRHECS